MSRFLIGATWDDAPHLTEQAKRELWDSMPPYQRDARSRGIPQLGAGAVYPVPESHIRIRDFVVPDHWRRGYGMDCGGGARPTAAVFGALDPDSGVLYITSVYKADAAEPSIHAQAIKDRMGLGRNGWNWPGVGDAAALIVTQHDAEQLVHVYRRLGLDLELPDKSVETGIADVWDLMSRGRLRVFGSCVQWFEEFRLYQRDKHGRIKKANDHLMDATRYLVRSGIPRMRVRPKPVVEDRVLYVRQGGATGLGWMGG